MDKYFTVTTLIYFGLILFFSWRFYESRHYPQRVDSYLRSKNAFALPLVVIFVISFCYVFYSPLQKYRTYVDTSILPVTELIAYVFIAAVIAASDFTRSKMVNNQSLLQCVIIGLHLLCDGVAIALVLILCSPWRSWLDGHSMYTLNASPFLLLVILPALRFFSFVIGSGKISR